MKLEEVIQGRITLPLNVFKYFETLLIHIKGTEYKVFCPDQMTYKEDELSVGLLYRHTKTIEKEVIRIFQRVQMSDRIQILVQATTDKLALKGIFELQTVLRPKLVHQLKDSYQFLIFRDEKGKEYLKQISLSHSIFVRFNANFNRLEFYSRTTLKKTQPLLDIALEQIKQFIENFKIPLRFSISSKDSSQLVEYLIQKQCLEDFSEQEVRARIKYENVKQHHEYIKEHFLKPLRSNMRDCQICFDEQQLFPLSLCSCATACKTCLKAHIQDVVITSLTDFKEQIVCPSCNKAPISIKDINTLFDTFQLSNLFQIRFKSAIDNLKSSNGRKVFQGCEFPDCKGLFQIQYEAYENKKQKTQWECPMCQHEYCIRHILNQKYDTPMHNVHDAQISCEASIKDLGMDDLVKLGVVKQCPKCKSKYDHEKGCNHLTCRSCQCHFCAVCTFSANTPREIYNHLEAMHSGFFTQVPVNIDSLKEADKKKLETIISKNIDGNNKFKATEVDEEELYQKLKINEHQIHVKRNLFLDYDEDNDFLNALNIDDEYTPVNYNFLFE